MDALYWHFLGLTLALEAPLYFFLLRHRPWKTRIIFWLAANLFSYPAVFYFFPYLAWPGWAIELAAEVWAPASEVLVGLIILPKFGYRDILVVALANLYSWGVGRWMFFALGASW